MKRYLMIAMLAAAAGCHDNNSGHGVPDMTMGGGGDGDGGMTGADMTPPGDMVDTTTPPAPTTMHVGGTGPTGGLVTAGVTAAAYLLNPTRAAPASSTSSPPRASTRPSTPRSPSADTSSRATANRSLREDLGLGRLAVLGRRLGRDGDEEDAVHGTFASGTLSRAGSCRRPATSSSPASRRRASPPASTCTSSA